MKIRSAIGTSLHTFVIAQNGYSPSILGLVRWNLLLGSAVIADAAEGPVLDHIAQEGKILAA
ncbi:hypothetical protein N9B24_00090 [bacterium]|nr:hypothetical protein [bacterium]MDA7893873.1 hypothetical protein [bacterium]MDB4416511.1 hypothetical protein [bacterium]MDB4423283.1 hypothetical protein [Rhodopirellula sp.]